MTDSIEALILRIVPSDGSTIGNGKVLEGLKRIVPTITEQDYRTVRDAMVDRGILGKGRGRGGAVYRNGGKPVAAAKSNGGSQGELWTANDIMTADLDEDDEPAKDAYVNPVADDDVGDGEGEDRAPERFAPAARSTTGRTRFEQAFKNIDDILWKEAGCSSELDYTEQASWLLFLKYLDGLEQEKAMEAELEGKSYAFILDKPYRWDEWAAPKNLIGEIDHNRAKTGDDLREFVNNKLFPYLHGFKQRASGPNTIEYKIGEIFAEIKNKISSGYNLREIIDHIDDLRFGSQEEKHELSHLYEAKIKNMGNAGRNGGEYYTPRPLIRAMVRVVDPRLGERIYLSLIHI